MLVTVLTAALAAGTSEFLTLERPESTPPGVDAGWGRVVGHWRCDSEQRQPDGSFTKRSDAADWSFFYTLDGTAIQDYWRPTSGGAIGTNLRTWDSEASRWRMVWATAQQPRFDEFDATVDDGRIVMTGELPPRGQFPAHKARIVFHEIEADQFDWYYEASGDGAPDSYSVYSRIHCRRSGSGS